jgi:hypothetical protein
MEDCLAHFPETLHTGADPATRFVRDPTRFAVRGAVPAELADHVEDRLDDESFTVIVAPADAARRLPAGDVVPVYAITSGGTAFVPTGRATVRFTTGDDAHAHAAELREAGYRITEVPPYAPHMAWVEGMSDDVAETLQRLETLARLPGVEHVEPQMVSRADRR